MRWTLHYPAVLWWRRVQPSHWLLRRLLIIIEYEGHCHEQSAIGMQHPGFNNLINRFQFRNPVAPYLQQIQEHVWFFVKIHIRSQSSYPHKYSHWLITDRDVILQAIINVYLCASGYNCFISAGIDYIFNWHVALNLIFSGCAWCIIDHFSLYDHSNSIVQG